jgi:hypothetical protein
MTQRYSVFEFALVMVVLVQLFSCNSQKGDSDHSATAKQVDPIGAGSSQKKTSELRLRELVGKWNATESSFSAKAEPPATMEAVAAAGGHAIYTVYSQGVGQSYYEASALWGISEVNGEIRVFEANNFGIADTHVGSFDSTGILRLELRDPSTNDLLQQRIMRWKNDTLRMNALFMNNGKRTEHDLVLVRQK